MKVFLAGYNVDANIIDELKIKSDWNKDNITPETLSASYARISRDPRDISDLRKTAVDEVDNARKSNENIIFGLGHASVAEHAVFNFDIIGISRLAVEQIQKFRLASYTEKSQRYITLDGDYYIPDTIKKSEYHDDFKKLIQHQNDSYSIIYSRLKEYLFDKYKDKVADKVGERTVDGWAKEDARYVVSLATLSQFGMTVNARTLEHMLRRFKSSNLKEIRELADNMYSIVDGFAPSIIKYIDPTPYDIERPVVINKTIESLVNFKTSDSTKDTPAVKLISFTEYADDIICSVILFQHSCKSYEECLDTVKLMTFDEKSAVIKSSLSYKEVHDNVDRYFEMVDFTFELTVSSSCYAQLKRHRMTTQIMQDYDISLGYTVPQNIIDAGAELIFIDVMKRTEEFYSRIKDIFPDEKNYILTNAHRRRVLLKLNGRALYHFISLRLDEHAQWDIRACAEIIRNKIREIAPAASILLYGKSEIV